MSREERVEVEYKDVRRWRKKKQKTKNQDLVNAKTRYFLQIKKRPTVIQSSLCCNLDLMPITQICSKTAKYFHSVSGAMLFKFECKEMFCFSFQNFSFMK